MPSYLYQEQFVPQPVYRSPLELYGQALQLKDAKFKVGLQNVRSRYDSILNADLTNETNQLKVRAGIQTAMSKLSKVAVSDLSLPENQEQANSLFDGILDDDVYYDMAWTKNYRNQVYKAESLQKNKPELVTPQNLHPLYRAQETYSKGEPGLRPVMTNFQPYYDYNKKYTEELDKVKADVDLAFSNPNTIIKLPDGKSVRISDIPTQQKIKSLKETKIRQLMWDRLSADPQALGQMKLDYDYNKDYGLYSREMATEGIDRELSYFTNIAEGVKRSIDSGTLSQVDKDNAQKQLDYANLKVTDLNRLKFDISQGDDPTKYFTYNQFIKDYVDGKATQFSYKEEDLIHAYPGWSEYISAEYKRREAESKKKAEDVLNVATPFSDIMNRLIENPNGVQVDDDMLSSFGEMFKDTDGKFYYNLSSDGVPAIVKPATQELTQEQIKTLSIATQLEAFKKDLAGVAIRKDVPDPSSPTGSRTINAQGDWKEALKTYYDRGLDKQTLNKFDELYPVQQAVAKYKGIFANNDVDITKIEDIEKVNADIQDPAMQLAVEIGQNLAGLNFRGRYEFRPDKTDLAMGTTGQIYTKGRLMLTKSQLSQNDIPIDKLVRAGLLSPEEYSVYKDDAGKTKGEAVYGLSVYLPIQGTPQDINERMLRNTNAWEGMGNKTADYKAAAREQVTKYMADVDASRGYAFGVPFVKQNEHFVPNPTTEPQKEEVKRIQTIAQEITKTTGVPYEKVLENVYDVLAINPSPVKRYQGLQNLSKNYSSGFTGESVAERNNNPLNIKDLSVNGIEAVDNDQQGHAIFSTLSSGLQAGYYKIANIYAGKSPTYSKTESLEEFSKKYAESPDDLKNLLSALKELGYTATASTKIQNIPIKLLYEALIMKEDRPYYNKLKSAGVIENFLNQIP